MYTSFQDVIGLWPSPDAMAQEIGASLPAARKWKQRNSIPAEWWNDIVSAARRHGHLISVDDLAALAASKREAAA
ncbi:carph-isopro domain-containing protein [Chelativorans xinjiangense]|uniref:carph-isopro domain-containing protein n=1 Tax=Chelativorans xinjiangense TaxID=2681485 RepID=UPI00135B1F87|nr:hypothetical protein [Chelativorans xinjiangense]